MGQQNEAPHWRSTYGSDVANSSNIAGGQTEAPHWRATYGMDVTKDIHMPSGQDYLRWDDTQTKWLDTPPSAKPPALNASEQKIEGHLRNLVFFLNKIGTAGGLEHFWATHEIEKYLQQPQDAASLRKIVQNLNTSLIGTDLRLAIESGTDRKLWIAKYDDKTKHFQSRFVVEPPAES